MKNEKILEEIKNFMNYLNDKVEDCYKNETNIAVERFLKRIEEEITNENN